MLRSEKRQFTRYNLWIRAKPKQVASHRASEELVPLCAYVNANTGQSTGMSFIDSMPIRVCHNMRINRNKVFKGLAEKGENSMGWFFGFKFQRMTAHL